MSKRSNLPDSELTVKWSIWNLLQAWIVMRLILSFMGTVGCLWCASRS